MATYSEVLDTSINLENINVYKKINEETNEHVMYLVRPVDGYVMYDTTANDTEPVIDSETGLPVTDPETGAVVERPVTYYYTVMYCPKTTNFDNFTWVAVPRDSVDENYIFGGGNNDHEVM